MIFIVLCYASVVKYTSIPALLSFKEQGINMYTYIFLNNLFKINQKWKLVACYLTIFFKNYIFLTNYMKIKKYIKSIKN